MATNQNRQNDKEEEKGRGNRSRQEGQSENRSNSPSQQESQSHSDDRGNSSNRGFAAMDDDQQREIASKGGKAVSRDREHMADIGRKGGESRNND
jgi:general stress protein YciG